MKTILLFIEQNKEPNEQFKEIEGTGGKYYISSFGRVVSACTETPYFIHPWYDNGYYRITIRING